MYFSEQLTSRHNRRLHQLKTSNSVYKHTNVTLTDEPYLKYLIQHFREQILPFHLAICHNLLFTVPVNHKHSNHQENHYFTCPHCLRSGRHSCK